MSSMGIYRRDEATLSFGSMGTTSTDVSPSTDTVFDVRNAKVIVVQVDRTATTYLSDSLDVNIISRGLNSTTYDTEPWHEITVVGSASVISSTIPTGPAYLKVRADNNSTSAKGSAKIVVQVLG